MHAFTMPPTAVERVVARLGRAHLCDSFDAARTALLVVDMQNHFVHEDFASSVPAARGVVDNINRLAEALRAEGGAVVWILTDASAPGSAEWASYRASTTAAKWSRRLETLSKGTRGYSLYDRMEFRPGDLTVDKTRFSAFIQGASGLREMLDARGISTVLVAGTATHVCCESTARDAMMLNYLTVMVSDGCATYDDEHHAASLINFYGIFGDVQTTDEVVARLGRNW